MPGEWKYFAVSVGVINNWQNLYSFVWVLRGWQVEIKDGKTCNVLDSVKIPLVRGRGTLKTFEVAKEPAIISISFWKDVKGVRKAYGVIEDMLLDKDFLQW